MVAEGTGLGRPLLIAVERRLYWEKSSTLSGKSSPTVGLLIPLSSLVERVAFLRRRGEFPGLFFLSGLDVSELDNFEGSIFVGSSFFSGSEGRNFDSVRFFLISSSRLPITVLLLIVARARPVLEMTGLKLS